MRFIVKKSGPDVVLEAWLDEAEAAELARGLVESVRKAAVAKPKPWVRLMDRPENAHPVPKPPKPIVPPSRHGPRLTP